MSEKQIGKVIQITGPVLDIRFEEGELPDLKNAIEIEADGRKVVAEVAQQVGDDVVRCIAISSTDVNLIIVVIVSEGIGIANNITYRFFHG